MILPSTYLRRVLTEKTDGKEDLFLYLIEGTKILTYQMDYPGNTFIFKGDKYFFNYDIYGFLWCSYLNYWVIFLDVFGMKHGAIEKFTRKMIKKHLQLEVGELDFTNYSSYENIELNFKLAGIT